MPMRSALASLEAWIRLADHHDVSIATDDAAVVTDGLDAGVYLHETFLALAVFELAGCHESLLSSAITLSGTTLSNGPVVYLTGLLVSIGDAATGQVIRAQLDNYTILRENSDVVLSHLARDVSKHTVAVGQLNAKHRVG